MKTNKILKPVTTLLFVLLTACMLTGCSVKFDASGYIKACLDANTHGEFAAYAEITKVPEEDIKANYDKLIDKEISYLSAYNLSEEKTADFRKLFIDIYKSFKYEVGEATKNDDGSYSVPVTTYKLIIFKDFMKEGETFITDYCNKEIEAGKTPTESELYPIVADFMYDYLAKNLEAAEYAEAVTTNVTVAPTADNKKVFTISDAELQSLLNSMIDLENAQ